MCAAHTTILLPWYYCSYYADFSADDRVSSKTYQNVPKRIKRIKRTKTYQNVSKRTKCTSRKLRASVVVSSYRYLALFGMFFSIFRDKMIKALI
jgi:hypothetical protein